MKNWQVLLNGIWKENPVLVQMLGMCPTLAVTNSAINAMGMAMATTFVLVCSSALISIIKKVFAKEVRIMGYITVIATFVTVVDLFMKAKLPDLSKSLGAFIALIVVNCIVLGRAEAFASKNNVLSSVCDAFGNGLGFLVALTTLGIIREILGSGSIFYYPIVGNMQSAISSNMGQTVGDIFAGWTEPWLIMVLAPGAFFGLAIIMAVKKTVDKKMQENASQIKTLNKSKG